MNDNLRAELDFCPIACMLRYSYFSLVYSYSSFKYESYFVCTDDTRPYSRTTTSSEPSEFDDEDEYDALERENIRLVMEEEELVAIGNTLILLDPPLFAYLKRSSKTSRRKVSRKVLTFHALQM